MADATRATLEQALALHRQGALDAAARAYADVLALQPDCFDALNLLGLVEAARGQLVPALERLDRAVRVAPSSAAAHNHRGGVQRRLGRLADARTSFERALQLAPGHVAAWINLAGLRLDEGDPAAAAVAARRALALAPASAEARLVLATAQIAQGQWASALGELDRLRRATAVHASVARLRGNALRALARFEEALASYDEGLQAFTAHEADAAEAIELLAHRALVLLALGRDAEAAAAADAALARAPGHAIGLRAAAQAALRRGRPDDVRAFLDRLLMQRPDDAGALQDRALAALACGDPASALADFGRALALAPDAPWLFGHWLHTKLRCADWQGLDAAFSCLADGLAQRRPMATPFQLLLAPVAPALQRQAAEVYLQQQLGAPPARSLPTSPTPPRLRVAYVSADWRDHPMMDLMLPVFERHDRSRIEPIGISLGAPSQDPLARRAMAQMDLCVDLHGLDDATAAVRVRALGLQLAIDLNGHTQGARPGLWARRIAPVQVGFLGYPGSSGRAVHDWLVADRQVLPAALRDQATESVLYLPDSYFPGNRYQPPSTAASRAEHGLPEAVFVFVCSNHCAKILPAVFDVWMALLRALPASVLWLRDAYGTASEPLGAQAAARGVDPQRLVFAPNRPRDAYLAALPLADLFLDTWPYGAHTTGLEALRAGLPLLTVTGDTFASRVGASLLHAAGLPELVTHDLRGYAAMALELARDPRTLLGLRHRLAAARASAPLFDTDRYVRKLECGWHALWQRQVQPPRAPADLWLDPRPPHV